MLQSPNFVPKKGNRKTFGGELYGDEWGPERGPNHAYMHQYSFLNIG